MTTDSERYLTTEEVRQRLRCSRQFVQKLVKKGLIPTITLGHFRRIKESEFNKFIDTWNRREGVKK